MPGKSAVAKSKYHEEIRDFLVSGWSPRAIRDYLIARHGESPDIPSVYSMERYRKAHIPPAALIPTSLIRQALGNANYRVDTLKTLDALIWAQEQRIAMAWKREQDTGKLDPLLEGTLRLTMEYVEKRHRIAVDLGVETPHGAVARLERHRTEVLEVPEAHLQEMMAILRERREELERDRPLALAGVDDDRLDEDGLETRSGGALPRSPGDEEV